MNLIGFHGTTKKNAILISENGFKIQQYNKSGQLPQDLGDGVYFYTDGDYYEESFSAKTLALKIGEVQSHNRKCFDTIEVLKCNIFIKNESAFLDLDITKNKKEFNKIRDTYKELFMQKLKSANPVIRKHGNIDGLVINLMVKLIKEKLNLSILVIKCSTYTSVTRPKTVSNFPNGTELSVRDTNIISVIN